MKHFIYNGDERHSFDLPSGWDIPIYSLPPEPPESGLTVSHLTEKAISQCLGAPRLEDTLTPEKKVAILTDDNARPTPVSEMLPVFLERLLGGGIRKENIDIVIASGTHSPLEERELVQKLGRGIIEDYRVSQHDCMAKDLIPIGRLETGCEIRINPIVAGADVLIGVGGIIPHPMNGFGGGPKILFPGVANYEAIREHHLTYTIQSGSVFGNLDGNPFYKEICRISRMAGLTYSLNCVFDMYDQVAGVFFGSFEAVHKQGAALSKELCGLGISRESDITMISAYPYMEPLQVIKPLITGSLVTKPGGTIILLAKTNRPMPTSFVETFEGILRSCGGRLREYVLATFESKRLLVETAPVDFNCALFFALICSHDHRIVLVSQELSRESVERMGFVHYHHLEEAIEKERRLRPTASVNLIPIGGVLPVLHEEMDGESKH